jgi:predicted HTH domain antitoxin
MNPETLSTVASELQIFQNLEEKKDFLFVLGALFSRIISLQKAAEIMAMEPEQFIKIIELMGLEFSYLTPQDVEFEKNW